MTPHPSPLTTAMQAIGRQLAAMPHDLYLLRLIHSQTRRPLPGQRLWTPAELLHPAHVRFLRIRNREGFDIYIHPYNFDQNAGYILLDLDCPQARVLHRMRQHGHHPCLVLQTSPGRLQAWIHVSASSLEPFIATAIARQLARDYGGDPASADWSHVGRLAGFTNQKPARRTATLPGSRSCMLAPGWLLRPAPWWSLPGRVRPGPPQQLLRNRQTAGIFP